MSWAQAQKKPEWDLWKRKVRETVMPMFADLEKRHPEYQATKADKPCQVTFEVTNEGELANIHSNKISALKDFDGEVGFIIFRVGNSPILSFPPGVKDKFVKCSLSFYPHGKVSPLAVAHPRPGEVFENRSEIIVPVERVREKTPPDVISY
jgi:hypothetical protein